MKSGWQCYCVNCKIIQPHDKAENEIITYTCSECGNVIKVSNKPKPNNGIFDDVYGNQ